MKQTAVEFLFEKVWITPVSELSIILKQAKEMEKEQIINAYKEGNHSEMRGGKAIFEKMEQYYNETFKSE